MLKFTLKMIPLALICQPFAQQIQTYYAKIPAWNMQTVRDFSIDLPSEITVSNIVSVSAVIHSDPDASGKIEVQNFESDAIIPANTRYSGRGGIIQVENNGAAARIHLMVRPDDYASGNGSPASRFSYPSTNTTLCGFGGIINNTGRGLKTFTSLLLARRGYVKICYLGTQNSSSLVVKSKVQMIGDWNMSSDHYDMDVWDDNSHAWTQRTFYGNVMPFSQFGFAANRITAVDVSINSEDHGSTVYTNFRRLKQDIGGEGPSTPDDQDGGEIIIDEAKDSFILDINGRTGPYPWIQSYFASNHSSAGNRGYRRVDYLAGGCDAGGSGFSLKVIGLSSKTATCTGTGNTVIEGSGLKVHDAADEFTYEYQQVTGGMRSLITRAQGISPASDFTTPSSARVGIMLRGGLNNNDAYAAVLVGNQGTGFFRSRNATGVNNADAGTVSIPVGSWLRLDLTSGSVIKAYVGPSGANPPTNWGGPIGSVTISGFPTTHYAGLFAVNGGEPRTVTGTFSNLSGFSPGSVNGNYYKIINKNSNKALDVSGPSLVNGGNVDQWTYLANKNQEIWQMVDLGTGYWRIVNKNSGLSLDVNGGSTANGANVQQWAWTGGTNQQWSITDLGGGNYQLTARHSGKVLDVNGNSTADGANVQQWTYGGGANQQWQFQAP